MALLEGSATALNDALARVNDAARDGLATPEAAWVRAMFKADEHFAIYGAGAPLRLDNPFFNRFAGQWGQGAMLGRKTAEGPLAPFGVPAIRWDPSGDEIAVQVLRSGGMPTAWEMVDGMVKLAFVRVLAPCALTSGEIIVANIYEPR